MKRSAEIHTMRLSAERVSSMLARDFGELENMQSARRGFKNFVETASARSTEKFMKDLSRARPGSMFLCAGREKNERSDAGSTWAIDPICGISNFARGIPQFATNVALMEGGVVTAGLTLDPMRGACFNSTLGGGSFSGNRNRLRVSGRESLKGAIVATNTLSQVRSVVEEEDVMLRYSGSVSLDLAYLSAGKCDVVISHDVRMWSIASGLLLIKEAGGFMELTEIKAGVYSVIAAASSKLLWRVKALLVNP
jgi:myo-inositol-1(or 4)-monophosphatase